MLPASDALISVGVFLPTTTLTTFIFKVNKKGRISKKILGGEKILNYMCVLLAKFAVMQSKTMKKMPTAHKHFTVQTQNLLQPIPFYQAVKSLKKLMIAKHSPSEH